MCDQHKTKQKKKHTQYYQAIYMLCVLYYIINYNIVEGELCIICVVIKYVVQLNKNLNYFHISIVYCIAIWYDRFE